MKKFERFIIYPLLLVTLFYIISGLQIIPSAEPILDKLVVREISVVNRSGQEVIKIGQVKNKSKGTKIGFTGFGGGNIEIYNRDGVMVISMRSSDIAGGSFIETYTEDGIMVTSMGGLIGIGGGIETYNKEGDSSVLIGRGKTGHGLINVFDKYGDKWTSYGYKP